MRIRLPSLSIRDAPTIGGLSAPRSPRASAHFWSDWGGSKDSIRPSQRSSRAIGLYIQPPWYRDGGLSCSLTAQKGRVTHTSILVQIEGIPVGWKEERPCVPG
jgi:hypothetical protein